MLSRVNNKVISDMEADDDDNGLMEPALAIPDDGAEDAFDLDIPPTTGNEYLRRVREEAKKCPQVVVASLDTNKYRSKQTVKVQPKDAMPAPKGFAPSPAWVKMQVDDFVALRQKLIKYKHLLAKEEVSLSSVTLPQPTDAESWCRLCFGRLQLKTKTEGGADGSAETSRLQNDGNGTPPLLSIVARMDQPTVIKVLEYHVNWLEATGFTHKQGQWFYSLLAVLQKPLIPESCSWLRQLARICSVIRATLHSPEDSVLHELNLLICLVAHYFDQGDLADKT
ncbi:gem-associated protein 2-like [Babylonia areolata]|uniref:gem-associated protein 2-like n=1 Tax=Babylonia areolata TaxID=304850 RepID=UPI003FD1854D